MRIWSLHPRYLDAKGLVACWREALLARHVLLGVTRGYTNHPQLRRFQRLGTAVGGSRTCIDGSGDEANGACASSPSTLSPAIHSPAVQAVDAYLAALHEEACRRNYKFDKSKFAPTRIVSFGGGAGVERAAFTVTPPDRTENARQTHRAMRPVAGVKRPRRDDSDTDDGGSDGTGGPIPSPLLDRASPLSPLSHDGLLLPCAAAAVPQIAVTSGQVAHEVAHLLRKLKDRDPPRYKEISKRARERKTPPPLEEAARLQLDVHPLFYVTQGPIESWEIV